MRDNYAALVGRYIDYVKLCLDHADLDVFDTPIARPEPPTPQQRREEGMVLSVLLSVLERAYLMYGDPRDDFERAQWTAWSAYIRAWAPRANFRSEWALGRGEYDAAFAAYMDGLIATTQPTSRPGP